MRDNDFLSYLKANEYIPEGHHRSLAMFLKWVCKAKVLIYLIILSPFQWPIASLMTLTWPCFFISFIPSPISKCFPNVRWINKWFHEATAAPSKHPCNKQRHSRLQILLNLRSCLITAYYDFLWQESQPGAICLPSKGTSDNVWRQHYLSQFWGCYWHLVSRIQEQR